MYQTVCSSGWRPCKQPEKKKAPVSEFASFSPFLTVFSCFFFQNIIFLPNLMVDVVIVASFSLSVRCRGVPVCECICNWLLYKSTGDRISSWHKVQFVTVETTKIHTHTHTPYVQREWENSDEGVQHHRDRVYNWEDARVMNIWEIYACFFSRFMFSWIFFYRNLKFSWNFKFKFVLWVLVIFRGLKTIGPGICFKNKNFLKNLSNQQQHGTFM